MRRAQAPIAATPVPEPASIVTVNLQNTRFSEADMSKNQHNPDSSNQALNQNNQMSDDPGDGSRNSDRLGRDGASPAEKAPPHDRQGQSTIEAFGEEGAGIAAKE
jgi:hypothetical protein